MFGSLSNFATGVAAGFSIILKDIEWGVWRVVFPAASSAAPAFTTML